MNKPLSPRGWLKRRGRRQRDLRFLEGGGELGRLIAGHDWAATSLGSIGSWPSYLRTTIATVLRSPVPIVTLWNEDGVMIYNDAYSIFADARHPALLGSKVREGWPEVADFNDNIMRTVLAGDTLAYREQELTLYRSGHAEQVWLNLDYSPVLNEGGKPTGVIAILTDVTEALSAERLARDAEASFQVVTQVMPIHVWTAQPDGKLDWLNDQALEYTGEPGDAATGERWAQLVHPEDAPGAMRCWAAAVQSGAPYETEFRIRRVDGAYRWFIARALPVRDGVGNIQRWIGTNTDIHARKLAEAESQNNRNRIWSLSRELMVIFGFGGIITAANPAVTRTSGWAEDELIGRNLMALLHPDDLALVAPQLARLTADGVVQNFEVRSRVKDGSYRLIGWTAVADAGSIHAIGRDVTDERAATREIERTWQLSPVVKMVSTMDDLIHAVNPAWTNLLGYSEAESVGHDIREFIVPENREAGERAVVQLAMGKPVQDHLAIFRTRSGERRRICWTIMPEGGLNFGFGRDITAEHEAAVALAASTAERERIWSSTNDLMGTAGVDGFLKAVNPAWTRLLGYTEEELFARSFMVLVDPADHEKTWAAVQRLAQGEAVTNFEHSVLHADGSRSLISWTGEPAGEIFHIVGRNVTEQRAAEEALRQSQKMDAVGQLTGGIAHDFNNLLQGITGSLDILQKRVDQGRLGELDRFVAGAMGAANRAAALTHRLLAFSRRQPLDPSVVRANPLVASMEDLLRRTMGERIELKLALTDALWLTLCDPHQLENAVLNLAINARDAMPDGGTLTIETANAYLDNEGSGRQRDVRPGQYVCISVSDTGTGMSQDTIAKAFEPFFTTKPTGQGTGLGLSMIYGFARQSEGFTKIYSELGQGTMVKLFLPRHLDEAVPDEDAKAPPAEITHSAGETVLVVEDEPLVRGLIAEVLTELGYATLEAGDGPSGLEILQSKKRIDLLITDIGLPGLNGRQVADAARVLRPDLKVLFMTGYAENATLALGFLEPRMAMITKPFAMEALMAKVQGIIEEA